MLDGCLKSSATIGMQCVGMQSSISVALYKTCWVRDYVATIAINCCFVRKWKNFSSLQSKMGYISVIMAVLVIILSETGM